MNTHTFGMLECEVQSGDEWYFHGNEVVVRDSSGKGVILVGRCDCDHDRANANRIVACVNACNGINPEAVPKLLEVARFFADCLRTRREGLKRDVPAFRARWNVPIELTVEEFSTELVRAALAKAEGGAA